MIRPYSEFIASKKANAPMSGLANAYDIDLPARLFPHQALIVRWALRRGKAAIFADTGLGKTGMQAVWAEQVRQHLLRTGEAPARVIVVAPLAVAAQTVREAEAFGVSIRYMRKPDELPASGIVITNYDMLEHFDLREFGGIVLDESSILKNVDGSTRNELVRSAGGVPYRLACTATPAPNSHDELGNHAAFLGLMSMGEMLSQYFVNDGDAAKRKLGKVAGSRGTKWRLKGHAREPFWRWVCTWGALIRKPSDLGFPDDGYDLPPLVYHEHVIPAGSGAAREQGRLFAEHAKTLGEQRKARKATVAGRVAKAAELVAAEPDEPWIIWCGLNDESSALVKAIPGAAEIRGSMTLDEKEKRIADFTDGRTKYLVTKGRITGFGVNWQHCARNICVGLSHSWEELKQLRARTHRFGQDRQVHMHLITSELEGAVLENVKRKDRDAEAMAAELSAMTREYVRDAVASARREIQDYAPTVNPTFPAWLSA